MGGGDMFTGIIGDIGDSLSGDRFSGNSGDCGDKFSGDCGGDGDSASFSGS
jgi:hypothetical protein